MDDSNRCSIGCGGGPSVVAVAGLVCMTWYNKRSYVLSAHLSRAFDNVQAYMYLVEVLQRHHVHARPIYGWKGGHPLQLSVARCSLNGAARRYTCAPLLVRLRIGFRKVIPICIVFAQPFDVIPATR